MIGTLIGIIVVCIILGVVWWAAQKFLALIPLAEPFASIVRILVVLVGVLVVIWVFLKVLVIAGIHVNMFGIF